MMFHWPVAEETLRKMHEEFDELVWELQSLAGRVGDHVPASERGQIDLVLKRAAFRRRWLSNILLEMNEELSSDDSAVPTLTGPPAKV